MAVLDRFSECAKSEGILDRLESYSDITLLPCHIDPSAIGAVASVVFLACVFGRSDGGRAIESQSAMIKDSHAKGLLHTHRRLVFWL